MKTFKKFLQAILVSTALVLLCVGCAAKKQKKQEVPESVVQAMAESRTAAQQRNGGRTMWPSRARDQVAPGYQVKIGTMADSNLNGKFRIDFDGTLELPYDVTIDVGGLTKGELKSAINAAYRDYFRGSPGISVKITEKRYYVNAQGLVRKPGQYLMKQDGTLDEVIAKAGGLQNSNDNDAIAAHYVRISQMGTSSVVRLSEYYAGSDSLIPEWQGGDSVFFLSEIDNGLEPMASEHGYVQMLGQVADPGEYSFDSDNDFFFYLAKAGGPTENADLDNIEIIRIKRGSKKTLSFDMEKVDKVPDIEEGDIVMVHARESNSTVSNFASVIGSISTAIIAAVAL